ncbi:MAG: hypothetical protein VX733_01810 [Candidatus Latescibacterota bacterium]|nr:hypothetical protein [Candidatus Latescibacterota bacterium]
MIRFTPNTTALSVLGGLLICAVAVAADESSWTKPPARAQLQQDPVLTPKGKGLLFVPAMSSNEPSYQVFRNGRKIIDANTGRSLPLDPGTYDVLIGSGTITQFMRKTVPIVDGETTVMKPDWTALVIDVLDRTRTSINESYELLEANTGETYGIGFGIEEERGERVRTWLLKPGVYHVVKVGESFTAIRKFSVQLLPGTLSQRNLVFDSDAGEFIGFYPRPSLLSGTALVASNVSSQTEVSGAVQVNTSHQTAGDDRTSLSLTVQIFNRTRYSKNRDFASIRVIFEEGATTQEGEDLVKGADRAEVRATYIRRLSRRIGPYLRGVINTTLFPEDARFTNDGTDLVRVQRSGQIDTLRGIREFTVAPSLSPMTLRQGIGINSQVYRSFQLNMDLRLGFGARQDLVTDTFQLGQHEQMQRATELKSTSSTGVEALFILDARLTRFVNLDSEFDLLMTSRKRGDWFFSWENRLRIALTSGVNLDLVADFERDQTLNDVQGREQLLLRFSRFY